MNKLKSWGGRGLAALAGGAMFFAAFNANAGVMFYTDQASFLSATSSTTLVDFEGVVADNGSQLNNPLVVDGVSFETTVAGDTPFLAGKNVGVGNPFDSAVLASGNGGPLQIDFSGLGALTAAGGLFGDSDQDGTQAVLSLFGAGNILLDTQNITVGDMGAGLPHTFFGWTTDGGDVITRIVYDMDGTFEVIDDLRYGTAGSVVAVSEPGVLAVLGLGVLGLGMARRKRAG